MARSEAITFKGNPMTLVGNELKVGQQAPDFQLHYFDNGLHTLTLNDLKGKPSLISVVPSLDTGVCSIQTRTFNSALKDLSNSINAVTVSLDLPFAQGRFCNENEIQYFRTASDYQDRNFGTSWGLLIDELKLLARAVYVLDQNGQVVYAEIVDEVAKEPNYEAAFDALKGLLAST
ncbi:MAG TPA: thiol peroxidase [Pirellulaceae bacterium]|nr:thiol peroxidase [Pirellulaceae bacterium]HMO92105.1 thiol peroxidase [Pirellulaceae bacterium]HMP69307.1 thiol peroxidase [Pirellulaceae bacterium]